MVNLFCLKCILVMSLPKYHFYFSYSLTLIDALDTLAVMGNYSEFKRVSDLMLSTLDFDKNINVSVFETNIRGDYEF